MQEILKAKSEANQDIQRLLAKLQGQIFEINEQISKGSKDWSLIGQLNLIRKELSQIVGEGE